MHPTIMLAFVVNVCRFSHSQRIHIGTQGHARSRSIAADERNHASDTNVFHNLGNANRPQCLHHPCRCQHLFECQLRMLVKPPPTCDRLLLQRQNLGQNRQRTVARGGTQVQRGGGHGLVANGESDNPIESTEPEHD
jgi:hypothetical protein